MPRHKSDDAAPASSEPSQRLLTFLKQTIGPILSERLRIVPADDGRHATLTPAYSTERAEHLILLQATAYLCELTERLTTLPAIEDLLRPVPLVVVVIPRQVEASANA